MILFSITIWCVCSHVRPLASQLNNFVVPCGFPDIRPGPIYIISLGFHMILFLYHVSKILDLLIFDIFRDFPDIRPYLHNIFRISHDFSLYFAFMVSDFLSFKIICGFPDFSQPYLHEISKISQDLIFIFCQ